MNGQEIIEKLDALVAKNDIPNLNLDSDLKNTIIAQIGDFTLVDEAGGPGGDYYAHIVLKFGDVYVKHEMFYSSYNGYDCDGYNWEVVVPKQKTIVVYE
jgi:hypothetical protein